MTTPRAALLFVALFSAACSSVPRGTPARLDGVPDPTTPHQALTDQARLLTDRGRDHAALELLVRALAKAPRDVDAHRVRQDVLRSRGRTGLVLSESERRLAEWGAADADARYLHARIQRSNEAKRAGFADVIRRAPNSFWGWLGLAFTYRTDNRERSLEIYRELYRLSERNAVVAIALASTLRATGQFDEALQVYGEIVEDGFAAGVGELGIVETKLSQGKRSESFDALHDAMRARPFDPGVHRAVRTMLDQGLPDERVERFVDVLFEAPERIEEFADGAGSIALARMLERIGQLQTARATLSRRDAVTPSPAERRHERRLTLALGEVRAYLQSLRDAFPTAFLADEGNRVRGRWRALFDGPWFHVEDPLDDLDLAVDLVHRLTAAGLLRDAETVGSLAMLRHGNSPALESLRDELRREIAFESALREIVYRGYQAVETSLEDVLEAVRRESIRILDCDVVGETRTFTIPLVGELVDPFESDLALHLARYNRHLVLGKRWAGTPEGMLLTRLSDRELDAGGPLPLAGRCREIVGDDRQIQSLTNVLGGDLAGVALLGHYVIDYDAVRDWARSILERRVIAREDELALIDDPLPDRVGPLEPADVDWRLSVLSPVPDSELEAAVFDMIAAHERTHLIDGLHFLPPASNLLRVFGLLLRHGFSPLSIESEMEGRAEAGALLASPHTRLVLAHIAGFVGVEAPHSPHAIGFTRLADYLNAFLADDPEWAHCARVSRWAEVPVAKMRDGAERFLAQ